MRQMATLTLVILAIFCVTGCGDKTERAQKGIDDDKGQKQDMPEAADKQVPLAKPGRTLLVTQSEFKANDEGKYTVPDAAVMLLVTHDGTKWTTEKIVDKESNVFHKALQYGKEGILTLGAADAYLKLWTKQGAEWTSKTLWNPSFGGKHNRLRDFEIADFDGDGKDDLAIATHDQGVVAVAWKTDEGFKTEELDRKENTFVHEIEIGDLDGDGKKEIFATPSDPNTASGVEQGGAVLRYSWNGKKFVKSEVVKFDERHIKEILVTDLEKDGKEELYAVLEAEMGPDASIVKPVEIRRFDYKDGKFESSSVATINDRLCRFLVSGDVDGDGDNELVAASFSSGIWVIEKEGEHWKSNCIEPNTGGFEHAIYLADLDGNGKVELYVGDDKHGALKRYEYQDGGYESAEIQKRLIPSKAMVWNITVADL